MINVKLDLPKELESQLNYLETISKHPKSFYIEKTLTKYLEYLEEPFISLERLETEEATLYCQNVQG